MKTLCLAILASVGLTGVLFAIQANDGHTYELVHYVHGDRYVDDHNQTYTDCILQTARDSSLHCERSDV